MKKILITVATIFFYIASFSQTNDAEALRQVLNNYKKAIEKLGTAGLVNLFVKDCKVYEQAKDEGTISNYLEQHLGPELKAFRSFTFGDYKVDLTLAGNYAFRTETYLYPIVLAKVESIIKSQGVATSELKKTEEGWKIVQTHSSFRKAKN